MSETVTIFNNVTAIQVILIAIGIFVVMMGFELAREFAKQFCAWASAKIFRRVDSVYVTMPEFSQAMKKVYADCQNNRDHCAVIENFSEHLQALKSAVDGTVTALEMLVLRSTVLTTEDKEKALKALR